MKSKIRFFIFNFFIYILIYKYIPSTNKKIFFKIYVIFNYFIFFKIIKLIQFDFFSDSKQRMI